MQIVWRLGAYPVNGPADRDCHRGRAAVRDPPIGTRYGMSGLIGSSTRRQLKGWKKGAAGISISVLAACGIASTALPSQAAVTQDADVASTTVMSTHSYRGTSPNIVITRTYFDGPKFSIPLSNEVAAGKITTISGRLGFTQQPYGMTYRALLCADITPVVCANVSPTGSWANAAGWNYQATSAFAGLPAYTTFYYSVQINDGGSGSIRPALNPARTSLEQTTNISYTY